MRSGAPRSPQGASIPREVLRFLAACGAMLAWAVAAGVVYLWARTTGG